MLKMLYRQESLIKKS